MNLKDGICTVHDKRGEGIQVVYRVTEDEWWKVHYGGNPVGSRRSGCDGGVTLFLSLYHFVLMIPSVLLFSLHNVYVLLPSINTSIRLLSIHLSCNFQGEANDQTIEYMYKWLKVIIDHNQWQSNTTLGNIQTVDQGTLASCGMWMWELPIMVLALLGMFFESKLSQ